MALVTFIVPSIGRASLERALASLLEQTDDDWEAIVVADGWSLDKAPIDVEEEPRIEYIGGPSHGSAGAARNYGLAHILRRQTQWIGFLDDDDRLSRWYVEHLREHMEDYPWADVVIFRMDHPQLGVLPPRNGMLQLGTVGISFVVRREAMQGMEFVVEDRSIAYHEDWTMIRDLGESGRKIFVSPHTDYFVREAHA